jgi:Ni/Co efflux regulator RcnB
MTKLFSALILSAFAIGAQAASHAGAAPMKDKASAPAAAASKADHKADHKAGHKAEKKEEAKK